MTTSFPPLPPRAAYLFLDNPAHRNALSLSVLRDLRNQLQKHNTSPVDGKLRILPPFKPEIASELEAAANNDPQTGEYNWLVNAQSWRAERKGLPNVIVLRSKGPVFCSGHDLGELKRLSHAEVKETFAVCAEVMQLIRRSPAPVVGVIQGLTTAAGTQLALTTDIPIARANTSFRLPGATLGLPCTSPSTAVSRKLGPAMTYRMLSMAEAVKAEEMSGAIDVVDQEDDEALEKRVAEVVSQLAERTAGQPQALGKWAFWTQAGLNGRDTGGDGYEEAVEWTGRIMAIHAKAEDAREGMASFLEKRKPRWVT